MKMASIMWELISDEEVFNRLSKIILHSIPALLIEFPWDPIRSQSFIIQKEPSPHF